MDTEHLPEAELLVRPPGVTIVAVVSGSRAPLAGRRVRPRSRIQNEVLIGIDAVAVRILQE